MRQICRTELDCELAKHARLLRSRARVNVTVALEFISFRDPESFTVSAAHTKVDDEVVVSLASVADNARTIRVSMCTTRARLVLVLSAISDRLAASTGYVRMLENSYRH